MVMLVLLRALPRCLIASISCCFSPRYTWATKRTNTTFFTVHRAVSHAHPAFCCANSVCMAISCADVAPNSVFITSSCTSANRRASSALSTREATCSNIKPRYHVDPQKKTVVNTRKRKSAKWSVKKSESPLSGALWAKMATSQINSVLRQFRAASTAQTQHNQTNLADPNPIATLRPVTLRTLS